MSHAARFAADVRRGRELIDDERPGEALRAFDTALARWRGEAFADLSGAYARTRLNELRAVAVEERLAARLAVGDAPGVAAELEAAVRAEPYRERRWELLILALYRGESGRAGDRPGSCRPFGRPSRRRNDGRAGHACVARGGRRAARAGGDTVRVIVRGGP